MHKSLHSYYAVISTFLLMVSVYYQSKFVNYKNYEIQEFDIKHVLKLTTIQAQFKIQQITKQHTEYYLKFIPSTKTLTYGVTVHAHIGYDVLQDSIFEIDPQTQKYYVSRLPPRKLLRLYVEIDGMKQFSNGYLNKWNAKQLTQIFNQQGRNSIKNQIANDQKVLEMIQYSNSNVSKYFESKSIGYSQLSQSLDMKSLKQVQVERILSGG